MLKIVKLKEMANSGSNIYMLNDWSNYYRSEEFKSMKLVIEEYYNKFNTFFEVHWNALYSQPGVK